LPEAIAEHRDIVAAVKAGDGQRAAQIMRAHITGFQAQFTAVL
jgi:DNA-binding GntR family transcriptional regulator